MSQLLSLGHHEGQQNCLSASSNRQVSHQPTVAGGHGTCPGTACIDRLLWLSVLLHISWRSALAWVWQEMTPGGKPALAGS